jgi:hypothetical protein
MTVAVASPFAESQTALAPWSRRIGLFAVVLLLASLALHRFGPMQTPVAMTAIFGAFALSGLALLVGIAAATRIWREGCTGAVDAAIGMGLAAAILAWPLALYPTYRSLPSLVDVSTHTADPPKFTFAQRVRGAGANAVAYPGAMAATAQARAYPDLKTVVVDRSPEDTFELAVDAFRKLRWRVTVEEPPGGKLGRIGMIEAIDRTLIIGFWDDVAVRVDGAGGQSRVDIRSSSRYGSHDFGTNARRIRTFVRELQARIEATAPDAIAARRGLRARSEAAVPKRSRDRNEAKGAQKSGPSRAPPDAQRAPAPKEQRR